MRIVYCLLFSFLLLGCTSTRETSYVQKPMPEWVKTTPTSSFYYIGISSVNKTVPNYRIAAQKNALENLSSDISVVISGESVLYSLETNEQFKQEFTQNVKLLSKEKLEGFELVDTWEDKHNYWVYYRLSKSKFAEIKEQRKQTAIGNAKAKFEQARTYEEKSQVKLAYINYVSSLEAIGEYLNEPIKANIYGTTVHLDHEIIKSVRRLESNVTLKPAFSSKKFTLGQTLGLEDVWVDAYIANSSKKISGIPIVFYYKTKFTKTFRKETNNLGRAAIEIGKLKSKELVQKVRVEVNFEALAHQSTSNQMILNLMGFIKYAPVTLTLNVAGPKVYLDLRSGKFGKPYRSKILETNLKTALNREGFQVVTSKRKCDLVFRIEANTTKNDYAPNRKMAFANGTFEVINRKTKQVVYTQILKEQKGVKIDFNEANEEAYRKLSYL